MQPRVLFRGQNLEVFWPVVVLDSVTVVDVQIRGEDLPENFLHNQSMLQDVAPSVCSWVVWPMNEDVALRRATPSSTKGGTFGTIAHRWAHAIHVITAPLALFFAQVSRNSPRSLSTFNARGPQCLATLWRNVSGAGTVLPTVVISRSTTARTEPAPAETGDNLFWPSAFQAVNQDLRFPVCWHRESVPRVAVIGWGE